MAKRNSEQDTGAEKAKVRVFFAEVEGSNDSVREALKTMVAAMNRPVQMIPARTSNANAQGTLSAQLESTASVDEGVENIEEFEDTNDETPVTSRKPRGAGPKKDRNAGIELVPNLDFVPDGKPALKAFFAEKAPTNDIENVLVVTYYMEHTMDIDAISPGHIRTALKHVAVSMPIDLKQTIRNMKKDKNWLDFSALDAIRVATEGENYVEHEMGKQTK